MDFFFKKKEQTSPARTTAQVAKKDIGTVGVGSEEEKKTASNNNNHSPSKKNSQNSKVFVLHARVVEGLDLVTSNDYDPLLETFSVITLNTPSQTKQAKYKTQVIIFTETTKLQKTAMCDRYICHELSHQISLTHLHPIHH